MILSLIQVGRRGYDPVDNTSIAGASVRLGILEEERDNLRE